MTLVDAGPLIALLDKGQGDSHRRCLEAQKKLTAPLFTTWPCFTEAMYFLGDLCGWPGQKALWNFVTRNALLVRAPTLNETARMIAHVTHKLGACAISIYTRLPRRFEPLSWRHIIARRNAPGENGATISSPERATSRIIPPFQGYNECLPRPGALRRAIAYRSFRAKNRPSRLV